MVLGIILAIIATVAIIMFWHKNIRLKLPSVALISGGVKTGKSTVGVNIAIKEYRKARFMYLIKGEKRKGKEEPLLYSNIPIKHKYYTKLLPEHILRTERIADRSIVYIDECSLLADSMDWRKESDINEELKMFFKLFGHECNGKCIMTTHSVKDVHYNIKRALSNFIWIHSAIKWVPFIYIAQLKEMLYTDEMSINVLNADQTQEQQCKWAIIPKSIWKRFDYRCYSVLTDDLPCKAKATKAKTLKTAEIVTIKGVKNGKK